MQLKVIFLKEKTLMQKTIIENRRKYARDNRPQSNDPNANFNVGSKARDVLGIRKKAGQHDESPFQQN